MIIAESTRRFLDNLFELEDLTDEETHAPLGGRHGLERASFEYG